MDQTQNWGTVSPELMQVAERARQEPSAVFNSLAHYLMPELLASCYCRQRAAAAVGVDGVSKESYGYSLEKNLQNLHERLRGKQYRHQPIKRVNIKKEGGGMRPLGISAFEDKLVQDALREVLSAVYEQDFLNCSYGFRPGRRAHDAIRALNEAANRGKANWVIEADIRSFFDSVPHERLMELLRIRIRDGSLERLVGKCLKVGILEGEELSTSDQGTPQGSVLSPLLANIYLHYVLDVWFEDDVKPLLKGRAELVRYADDFVICFEREDDARRVYDVLPKRMENYGLSLHPDKTRLIPFERPPHEQKGGKGPGSFDFLGFTMYWKRMRTGKWCLSFQTRSSRLGRAIQRIGEYCRLNRHLPVKEQHAGLSRRLRGHFNYFGVNGNGEALEKVFWYAKHLWVKWLRRRSQRSRPWEHFDKMFKRFPLPAPRISVRIWGK
jgi:group II intron reverse transcriptase/maturase